MTGHRDISVKLPALRPPEQLEWGDNWLRVKPADRLITLRKELRANRKARGDAEDARERIDTWIEGSRRHERELLRMISMEKNGG